MNILYFIPHSLSLLFVICCIFFGLKFTERSHMRERARLCGLFIRNFSPKFKSFTEKYLSEYFLKQLMTMFDIMCGFIEGIEGEEHLVILKENKQDNYQPIDQLKENNLVENLTNQLSQLINQDFNQTNQSTNQDNDLDNNQNDQDNYSENQIIDDITNISGNNKGMTKEDKTVNSLFDNISKDHKSDNSTDDISADLVNSDGSSNNLEYVDSDTFVNLIPINLNLNSHSEDVTKIKDITDDEDEDLTETNKFDESSTIPFLKTKKATIERKGNKLRISIKRKNK
jgi:hypothetical protein